MSSNLSTNLSTKAKVQTKFALPLPQRLSGSLTPTNVASGRVWSSTTFPAAPSVSETVALPLPPMPFLLGFGLVIAFFLQTYWQVQWQWLTALQNNESYRLCSGTLLALYLASQFLLPLARWRGSQLQRRYYRWHQWQGAFAPLLYYIHSTQVGYAYLLCLSLVYFANVLVGLFSAEVTLKYVTLRHYSYYWLISHISLSLLTVALVIYHIYIVFAYS